MRQKKAQFAREWSSLCKLSRVLLQNSSAPLGKTLTKVASILVSALGDQVSAVRVEIDGMEVSTDGFCPAGCVRSCQIMANGIPVGVLEVCSPQDHNSDDPNTYSDETGASSESSSKRTCYTGVEKALVECAAACLGLLVERAQADDALRLTENHLAAIGNLSRDGIWVIDADGCTTYLNPRMEEMLGRTASEVVGKPITAFVDSPGGNGAELPLRLGQGNGPSRCELELIKKGGRRFWVNIEAPPPKSSAEKVSETLLVVSDISETKRRQIDIVQRSIFDELLSQILCGFASCSTTEIDVRIEGALRGIATFIGVEHAWVMNFSKDKCTWSVPYEWSRVGTKSTNHSLQGMPMESLAWSEEMILAGHSITVNAPGDYPQEAVLEQRLWVDAGCVSRLCVPIKAMKGDVVGCLGLHSHAKQMTWTECDLARLTLVANAIALALERGHTENELIHA